VCLVVLVVDEVLVEVATTFGGAGAAGFGGATTAGFGGATTFGGAGGA